jgi:hypothetical protein
MNIDEKWVRLLSLVVALLTLWTLWESHQLHRLEMEEKCARRRLRRQMTGGVT